MDYAHRILPDFQRRININTYQIVLQNRNIDKESHGPITGQKVEAGLPGPWRQEGDSKGRKGVCLVLERGEPGSHVRSQNAVTIQATPTGRWSGEFSN